MPWQRYIWQKLVQFQRTRLGMSALFRLSRERERDGVRVDGGWALALPPHPRPLPPTGARAIPMPEKVFRSCTRNSLRTAQSAYAQGDFDSCASRAYFAVFQAEIAALIKLTEFRHAHWRHDRVQAEFNRRLILARKLFSASLRSTHYDLVGIRHTADYSDQFISTRTAEQCLRKAAEMFTAIERILGEP